MQRLPAFLTVQHSTENRDESIRITTALLTGTALVHAGEMKGMEMKGEMKGSRARQEHELACDDNLQEDLIMDIQGTNMNIPMKRWSISTSTPTWSNFLDMNSRSGIYVSRRMASPTD